MNRALQRVAILLLILIASIARGDQHREFVDDFHAYAEGSAGEPAWDALHVGFSIAGKAMRADVANDRGVALLQAVPMGRALRAEAVLIPRGAKAGQWKTAGVGIYFDAENYWQLALVESPEGRHFAEFAENLDGVWNAQATPGSRLLNLDTQRGPPWQYGHTYRMCIDLRRQGERNQIRGEVYEGETLCYRCAWLLDAKAVTCGRPMLSAGGCQAEFCRVMAKVDQVAPAAQAALVQPTSPQRRAFKSSPLAGGPAQPATGFFHVAAINGTWWLVDPHGQPTLSIGTDHVRWDGHFCQAMGHAPYGRNVARRYGTADVWAAEATRRLRQWNFNVVGAGCSSQLRYQGLAHTEFLAFGSDFSSIAALTPKTTWTGWPDVFDPRFERFCQLRARQRCQAGRDDPWLLGYFLDNELEWMGKHGEPLGLAIEAGTLPATSAGKKALVALLRHSFHDVAAFNTEFATKIASFEELPALNKPFWPKTSHGREVLAEFIADAAERYFRITTAAVRHYDPNHLILGCRFAHDAPDAAWQRAGATCDIVSVNVYPRIDLWKQKTVDLEKHLRHRFADCGKPLMLTEWGFPALDAKDSKNRPLPCMHGAGMRVDTQSQKAACYAIFQRDLFSLPFVVGSHYFMWCDEPALGISDTFPEDSNYGLVSESDEPYALLTAAAARVNARLADLHAGRIARGDIATGFQQPRPKAPEPGQGKVSFARTAAGYTIDSGPMKLVKDQPGGKLFDRILLRPSDSAAWIELGCYEAVLQAKTSNGNCWPHADRLTAVRVKRQDSARLVLELEVACDAPQAWKAAYCVEVEAGRPAFRARGMWIENTGQQSWQLAGYFHYLPSKIGGDAKDDQSSPGVPNYWISVASWYNPKLRVRFGVMPAQNDPRIESNFWKDEQQGEHPDCRRVIERELKPGQRWTAADDEPTTVIFGIAQPTGSPPPWMGLMGMTNEPEG